MLRILCIAVSLLLIAPQSFAAAQTSLVVLPVHDGIADEASDKTAAVLRDKLSALAVLHVVETGTADAVLSYYRDYNLPSDDPQTAEANDLLVRAKEHYFHFAYAEAEAELKKAIALQKEPVLQEALITLGLVYAAQKSKGEAVDTFKKTLILNPLYRLDAKNFAPSIVKLFTQAAEEIQKLPSGTLEIASNPKVADVWLNGGYVGVTPQVLKTIPAGEYRVLLKANHYGSWERQVVLKEGETKPVFGKLYWGGRKKGAPVQRKSEPVRKQIEEGVRSADLLKTDKALLVNADEASLTLRLVDRRYRAGHNPIVITLDGDSDRLAAHLDQSVRFVLAQTELRLLKNPTAYLDPDGVGDPVLLGRQPRKSLPKGVWIGGLGALGAGGLIAGILAASAGSSAPQTGTVSLNFK